MFVLGFAFTCCSTKTQTETLSPKEAREIAKEVYIFAYPMLMGYQAQYYTTMPQSPGYRGPWNKIAHDIKPADHTQLIAGAVLGSLPSNELSDCN